MMFFAVWARVAVLSGSPAPPAAREARAVAAALRGALRTAGQCALVRQRVERLSSGLVRTSYLKVLSVIVVGASGSFWWLISW